MALAQLDHLAISAQTLATGVAAVEAALGVALAPGGRHPHMGTHNRLLSLGPGLYLEVIAIDPEAAPPGRPRWFGLDRFEGPPRPSNWILRCDDLDAALAAAPAGSGRPVALSRGALEWTMAVPDDGMLPFGGLYPALIQWRAGGHPAERLPDAGIRLARLEVIHPEAAAFAAALAPLLDDPRVAVREGRAAGLRAVFDTPAGQRVLGP